MGGAHADGPRRGVALLVAVVLASSGPLLVPSTARAASLTQLRTQLAALRAEAAPAGRAYDAAQTLLENTQYRIKRIDARMRSENAKLADSQATLSLRADEMYREGGDLGFVEFLFGASSWSDFVTRVDFVSMIASSDAALVRGIKATKAQLAADRAALVKEAATERRDAQVARTRMNVMNAALASKKHAYDLVLAQIAAQMAKDHPGGGSYPPGPDGLVFPVRGMHFYSDTWGAPRSGGRHHMGTDIMAARGTPVVAVSSGYARPHYNGLGGKSITLTGDNGWSYYYAHLNAYAVGGGHVSAGQVIGYVGNTGDAAGGACHLHIQMGPHGNWVDPYYYLRRME